MESFQPGQSSPCHPFIWGIQEPQSQLSTDLPYLGAFLLLSLGEDHQEMVYLARVPVFPPSGSPSTPVQAGAVRSPGESLVRSGFLLNPLQASLCCQLLLQTHHLQGRWNPGGCCAGQVPVLIKWLWSMCFMKSVFRCLMLWSVQGSLPARPHLSFLTALGEL